MRRNPFLFPALAFFLSAPRVFAQAQTQSVCAEEPREDALPTLCSPPSSEIAAAALPGSVVLLSIPSGTPLRIAIDQRARIQRVGEAVHGVVVESVYAFDERVIPAGSLVTGRVTKITQVPAAARAIAYANGNFSPFHKYEVNFDTLVLPNGEQRHIDTTVSPGTAEVVHLVATPEKEREKKKNAAARAASDAKQEAQTRVHDTLTEISSPGRMHRLKNVILSRSPYRRQYLEPGTRFNAVLDAPLAFGQTTRTYEQLAHLGATPAQDSVLRARLIGEVSSANATQGTGVTALLTEPVYSPDHHLLLPADTRLVGEVTQAKPARKLHHNGQLRLVFTRMEIPDAGIRPMQGSLEGVEVDRAAHLKLDEEGGAHATDSKTRYLSTGFALLLAAAAARPDVEHGGTDAAGDPSVRAGAGLSGYGFTGSLITLAARSQPVSIAFGVYGASTSIYSNFLSRGKDVVLPKDTPLEIGLGRSRAEKPAAAAGQPPASR